MAAKHIYGPGGEYRGKITDEGPSSSSSDPEGCLKACILPFIFVLAMLFIVGYSGFKVLMWMKRVGDEGQAEARRQIEWARTHPTPTPGPLLVDPFFGPHTTPTPTPRQRSSPRGTR